VGVKRRERGWGAHNADTLTTAMGGIKMYPHTEKQGRSRERGSKSCGILEEIERSKGGDRETGKGLEGKPNNVSKSGDASLGTCK